MNVTARGALVGFRPDSRHVDQRAQSSIWAWRGSRVTSQFLGNLYKATVRPVASSSLGGRAAFGIWRALGMGAWRIV